LLLPPLSPHSISKFLLSKQFKSKRFCCLNPLVKLSLLLSCFSQEVMRISTTPSVSQRPIGGANRANDSVQDKGIERGIQCIGLEGFDQVRLEWSIRVSRGGPNTSYPYARGAHSNLIWAMR
jgi:hypothetical protein